MNQRPAPFLRYPGGKGRMLDFLIPQFPSCHVRENRLVEPFVGGGAVFFALSPERALLSDINSELIELYSGIRRHPVQVWEVFRKFPSTKDGYYEIRSWKHKDLELATRAARTLYLNRTCFKGMWRHNSAGEFNVGYGGQDRRWVIGRETLVWASQRLKCASLKCNDFEEIIDSCREDDFIFVDPPYRPGEREMIDDHYTYGKFNFDEHRRLAATLHRASVKGIPWAMTTSAHPDIVDLFRRYHIMSIPRGTGRKIGALTRGSGEVVVRNYQEESE